MIDLENKEERNKLIDDFFNKGLECNIKEVYQAVVNTVADLEYEDVKKTKEIERLKEDNEYLNKVNVELSTEKNRLNNIINKAIEILDIYGTSNYETADLLYSTLRGSDKE